jgi:hypothetical protein
MGGRRRRPFALGASCVVLLLVLLCAAWTWSAFSGTTANPGNAGTAGTVALTDNDSGSASFTLSDVAPGDTDTSCIQVTYTGSLPALVRLYGTTTGTGLDPYLTLEVTRGTGAGTFDDCTGFTADATNYIGQGAGVVYNGTLTAFADDWTAGVADPRTASVPEAWTTSEAHVYRLRLTVADNNSAQGKNMTQTFTWEARNTTLYSQVVLSDQPASYWKLDETNGTTAADATGAHAGTYSAVTLNRTTGVKDAGTAVGFDDTQVQLITIGDYYGFTGTTAFSAEIWASPSAHAVDRRLFSKEGASGTRPGWRMNVNTNNRVSASRLDASGVADTATSTTTLAAGTWYHLVVTYDGANLRLYVNGTLEATVASTRSAGSTTNALRIGRYSGGGETFGGDLDEAAVYTTVLTQQQVTEHYNAGHR